MIFYILILVLQKQEGKSQGREKREREYNSPSVFYVEKIQKYL